VTLTPTQAAVAEASATSPRRALANQERAEDREQGQRRINLLWEVTQSLIALLVTCGALYAEIQQDGSDVLNYAFFLVIGFYYSRTNHSRTGGVGETR
jgi:hypothetical protein